jgi:cytochrome c551/c552
MKLATAIAAAVATFAFAGAAVAGPGEDLIDKEKCSKCHTAKTTKKGPSFADVAGKHKADAGAAAKLVAMLKTGVPLSGSKAEDDQHKKVAASDADLQAAVAVILSSK